jgi:hypothetical protein
MPFIKLPMPAAHTGLIRVLATKRELCVVQVLELYHVSAKMVGKKGAIKNASICMDGSVLGDVNR